MKIKIIHLPKKIYRQDKFRGYFITIMPLGLLPMADLLRRDGNDVEIVHAGVEEQLNAEFDAAEFAACEGADIVCLPLHWHQQTYVVHEALRRIKELAPGAKTVLGGLTASVFAGEILNEWPAADFVIRGEGERPLRELAAALESGGSDFEAVPNLVWRKDGRAVHNPVSYVAGQQDIDGMVFADRSLIRNQKYYTAHYYFDSERDDVETAAKSPIHYLYVGRGCTADCAFCGGGAAAHNLISNRPHVIFRKPEAVFQDIKSTVENYGISDFYVCFDPPREDESYYIRLFDMVRAAGLRVSLIFEYYNGVPDDEFIESFAATFDREKSQLAFSPTAFSDSCRRRFYPPGMSNRDFVASIKRISAQGVKSLLYYALLPGESESDVREGLSFMLNLRKEHWFDLRIFPIEIEPAAPWSIEPSRFGISLKRKTLSDYLAHHARRSEVFAHSDLGYKFSGFHADKKIFDVLAQFFSKL